jgi:hypothetical protein
LNQSLLKCGDFNLRAVSLSVTVSSRAISDSEPDGRADDCHAIRRQKFRDRPGAPA